MSPSRFIIPSKNGGLSITRRQGEEIVINYGEIVIEVVEIRGKTVKLAFQADKEVSITRKESVDRPKKF